MPCTHYFTKLLSIFETFFPFSFLQYSFTSQTLCLIYCSNSGLTETELRKLLAAEYDENVTSEELPRMLWVKIYRKLKNFLINTSSGRDEIYYFFHSSIEEVRHFRSLGHFHSKLFHTIQSAEPVSFH